LKNKKERRVTAVVAKVRYHKGTKNQAPQQIDNPAGSRPSNTIIKVLLDRSDGDLMFHEKGTPIHSPYLTRQVPNSWHMSNGSYSQKEGAKSA
jgi:hypothetical protein